MYDYSELDFESLNLNELNSLVVVVTRFVVFTLPAAAPVVVVGLLAVV